MTSIWILMVVIDVALLSLSLFLFLRVRQLSSATSPERLNAYLNVLEKKALELEKETSAFRGRMESNLDILGRICDQAKVILERGKTQTQGYVTSDEENELRTLNLEIASATRESEIPSVSDIERTRERMSLSTGMDLKTVLRGQLA